MKFKLTKDQWEKIGKDAGWLKVISYALVEPPKLCDQCGKNPVPPVKDENTGEILGYGDYCPQCEERMDNGPFTKLLRKYGPEEAARILKEILHKPQMGYQGDVPSAPDWEEDQDDENPDNRNMKSEDDGEDRFPF
jgi:hypothetical protein